MRCDSQVSPWGEEYIYCDDDFTLPVPCNCFAILLSSGEGMLLPGTSGFLNSPSCPLGGPARLWLVPILLHLRADDEE